MIISRAFAAAAGGHGEPLLQSAEFWLAVTFVILVLLSVRPLVRGVRMMMVIRAAKIKKTIIDARILRTETEQLLNEYLQKQEQVDQEISRILDEAKKSAQAARTKAEADLKRALAVKEKAAVNNIGILEEMALSEIKDKVAEITLSVARQVIEKNINPTVEERIMNKFTANLSDNLDRIPPVKH